MTYGDGRRRRLLSGDREPLGDSLLAGRLRCLHRQMDRDDGVSDILQEADTCQRAVARVHARLVSEQILTPSASADRSPSGWQRAAATLRDRSGWWAGLGVATAAGFVVGVGVSGLMLQREEAAVLSMAFEEPAVNLFGRFANSPAFVASEKVGRLPPVDVQPSALMLSQVLQVADTQSALRSLQAALKVRGIDARAGSAAGRPTLEFQLGRDIDAETAVLLRNWSVHQPDRAARYQIVFEQRRQ